MPEYDGAGALREHPAPTPPTGMPKLAITLALVAQVVLYMAFIVPTVFSLAIFFSVVAPENKDASLALALGLASFIGMIVTPAVGVLSDRTRSRMGRRRPWLLLGTVVGTAGTALIATATSATPVVVGWIIANAGYNIVGSMILAYFSDQLAEEQRGRVLGINGALSQIAPILGVGIASAFVTTPSLMFLAPGAVAAVGLLLLSLFMKDPVVAGGHLETGWKTLGQTFWFNPKRYPQMAWVWLSRAFVWLALAFSNIYGVYLIGDRLGLDPQEIGGLISLIGIAGVGTGVLGAVVSGFLSDRLRTRKPFLMVGTVLLAVSMVVVATTASMAQYIVGMVISSFAIAIYAAVDQALMMDVLPAEEGQNGRYLAIFGLTTAISGAVGPLLAGLLLGASGGEYGSVYLAAAAFAIVGALALIPVRNHQKAKDQARADLAAA